MMAVADGGDVGKEDRKEQTLAVLVDSEAAMPPGVIFRNAKLRGATYERRIINEYLSELHDEGHVIKVDPDALEGGDIKEIGLSEQGYFIATDKGRERLSE